MFSVCWLFGQPTAHPDAGGLLHHFWLLLPAGGGCEHLPAMHPWVTVLTDVLIFNLKCFQGVNFANFHIIVK